MEHKWKRWTELLLLLVLAAALAWGSALESRQQEIAGSLIRLHVTADSDSPRDQAAKLEVRDVVLETAGELLKEAGTVSEARAVLAGNLPALRDAAAGTLQALGMDPNVSVSLGRELFGTRDYDTFSLPGGYYDALRVTIGSGQGRNWWCVVYPQICTAATAREREMVAVMGGMDRETLSILEGQTPEYRFKLRSLELLEDLLGWVRAGKEGIPPGQ